MRVAPIPRAALLLLPIAAACLVYANSTLNGFALDDVAIIQNNARVHDLSDLRAIWLTPYWPYFGVELGLWRPFAIFLYAVQWAVGGGEPWMFHTVSIALHAAATALVFLLLESFTDARAACAAAIVFAVHPLHTEAVANVVGQAELIAAAAMIGACVVHARRPDGAAVDWPRRLALVALFAVAILTKEHAVVLPALLLIVDVAQRRIEPSRAGILRYLDAVLMPLLLLGAALGLYLIARFGVLEGALLGTEAGPQLHFLREEFRVLNALRAFPELLRLLFVPWDLSADYSPAMILPVESFTPMTAIGALLLLASVGLALALPWRPAVGFAAAWFLITIITVSNLIFPIGVLIAERTLYLPSLAVSAVVAYGWRAVSIRVSARRLPALQMAFATVVILFGVRTWTRNPDWRSTQSVLSSVMRDHPESYKAQWTHASWQWQLGRPNVARYHYEAAYRIYSRDSQLLTEYGNFLLNDGDTRRAVDLLERAFELHSYVPRTTLLLGTAYLAAHRYSDALRLADHALDIGLSHAAAMPIRAAALEGIGAADRALAVWRFVIRNSTLHEAREWALLAQSLARNGHVGDAGLALQRGRQAAQADSAGLDLMDRVENAIEAGCFSALPADLTDPADPAAPAAVISGRGRACDAVSAPNAFVPGLQNANVLQNARETGGLPVPADGAPIR